MNKRLLIAIFCILNLFLNAQKNSYGENDIAEFQLEDGSSFKGYFIGAVTNTVNMGQLIVYNKISGFKYATLDDQKRKEINSRDVKKVIFYHGSDVVQIQEKIKVKTVNNSGKLSNDTYDAFEYLLYDGRIRLYSSNVYECQETMGCFYTHSNFYIQKKDEPYAVLAVKSKSQFSSKIGSSIENIVDAFRAVGGNCSSFNQYLDTFDKDMMKGKQLDKTLMREYQEIFKTALQDGKNDRDKLKKVFETVSGKVQNRQAEIYMGLIKEYEKNCP